MIPRLIFDGAVVALILLGGNNGSVGTPNPDSRMIMPVIIQEAQSGNLSQALVHINCFIATHPRCAQAYLIKAQILAAMNASPDQVLNVINAALVINPVDVDALSVRAQTYISLRNYRAAISDYDLILQLQPRNVQAISNRYQLHMLVNDLQAALLDCRLMLDLNPDNPQIYVSMAQIYMQLRDRSSALVALQAAASMYRAREDQSGLSLVYVLIANLQQSFVT